MPMNVSCHLTVHCSSLRCHSRAGSTVKAYAEQAVDKLRLRVLDAHALGDPGFLGEATLDLRPLQLQPNAPPVNIWLPLQVHSFAAMTYAQVHLCLLFATGCGGQIEVSAGHAVL